MPAIMNVSMVKIVDSNGVSTPEPRKNWDKAFEKMAQRGDDVLLDESPISSWDVTEWEWLKKLNT